MTVVVLVNATDRHVFTDVPRERVERALRRFVDDPNVTWRGASSLHIDAENGALDIEVLE